MCVDLHDGLRNSHLRCCESRAREHNRTAAGRFGTVPGSAAGRVSAGDSADQQVVRASPADACDLRSVAVIIPALNEEKSLPLVLRDLPPVGRVIVVDNGSTDATAEVAASLGATVVCEPVRGYGAACLRGLQVLRDFVQPHESAPQVVVFLDADYSDDPRLLPALVRPVLRGEADLVLGSRLRGKREPGALPPHSALGNRLACLLMKCILGASYTDLGPFRAIRYDSLRVLNMADMSFGWTIEMQVKAVQMGLRVMEVPAPYRRRIGRSKISGTLTGSARAAIGILGTLLKYALYPSRKPPQEGGRGRTR